MRIGLQIERFDPARGGAETYVFRLGRRLAAEGHKVTVFTGSAVEPPPGVSVCVLPDFRPEAVRPAVAGAGLDVVIGTGNCLGMSVLQPHGGALAATMRQNLALVRNPLARWSTRFWNAISRKRRRARNLERRQLSQADPPAQIVAVSEMVARDFRAAYPGLAGRLHVVYNGVDTAAFSPERCAAVRGEVRREWGLADDKVCFVLVAHNFPLKGVRELIEAAARLRRLRSDFRVVVVGRGGQWGPAFRTWRLGCRDVVQFVGPVDDAIRAFAAADAYVHPTWYDPCSLAVMEAWACALPTVTTRFNGAAGLMTEGREGFVLDTPADTAGLAARMADLMDVALRRRMGAAARTLAERHTEDDNLRGLMAVIARAAARKT